jgi:D-threo-aldose 1-dehydrogenase
MELRKFGDTDLKVPPIIFGTSCFGNLYRQLPYERKLAIASEWFEHVPKPVVLDSAGKYGAGLALEMLGRTLGELGVKADEVLISNKLGWKRMTLEGPEPTFEPGAWFGIEHDARQHISYEGILECWEQGCELLGGWYKPSIVSVHDPDEYLAVSDAGERDRRFADVVEAYRALVELRDKGQVKAVGVGAKDWKVIRELAEAVELDWVMFACSLTVYTHPVELLEFMAQLRDKGVAMINSAVFNAGFLIGGEYFDYRKPLQKDKPGLFEWRKRFLAVCGEHGVEPAVACVQFGLSVPGVVSVALNTSKPERVRENVEAVTAEVPEEFWVALKKEKLIAKEYPYL